MDHRTVFRATQTQARNATPVVAIEELSSPGAPFALSIVVPVQRDGDAPLFVNLDDFDPATQTPVSLAEAQAIADARNAANVLGA